MWHWTCPRGNGLNWYIERLSSQRSKIHILFKCTCNIYKDRPHDRIQNKPQQIQENWIHIKHFLWPLGTETRNKSQGKNPQTLKNMEIEYPALKQWTGEKWDQRKNQKVSGKKWKWNHNNPKPMGHSKGSPEREGHSNTGLPTKARNISNNHLTLHVQELEE